MTPFLQHNDAVTLAVFSPDGRRILTTSRDRTARLWTLSADNRDIKDLLLMAQLITGKTIRPTGPMPLKPGEMQTALQKLQAKYPFEFTLPKSPRR